MQRKYDILVFIGRFQPFHKGHLAVVERASELADRVIVLVGSSFQPRSTRNPFTFDERKAMIQAACSLDSERLIIRPIEDRTYNDTAWIAQVQAAVKKEIFNPGQWTGNGIADYSIGLIGCQKDSSSYYLKMFPDWASENVEFLSPIDATAIRKMMFTGNLPARHLLAGGVLAPGVCDIIETVTALHADEFDRLDSDFQYEQTYSSKWGEGPFLTADALVQVGGKILLIERGGDYGSGLLALPGGFINKNEKFEDAAIRELREETRLRVPIPVLKGSIVGRRVFDDPFRSARARIVTECFHFRLSNDTTLPEVRGSDDAKTAKWVDVTDISSELMFEDHYHMISLLLGIS